MPAVKTSTLTKGAKSSFSPYNMHHHTSRMERGALVRIVTPSMDDHYSNDDFSPFDGYYGESHFSQWMQAGPMFTEMGSYGSASPCPPSFASSPSSEDNVTYEGPLDGTLFPWAYESNSTAGYGGPYTSYPESSTSSNTFSPSISIISSSPRSDHSGSPQPSYSVYPRHFNFEFTPPPPNEFSSPSSNWSSVLSSSSHSPKSSTSHSPSPSCSSVEAIEIKTSPSREPSPLRAEIDPQQQRRRFPCLIIGCERRFTSQYTLKVHMEAHKPKPRSSFPCTLGCSERFSRQHDRLRHEVAKHGKICEFSCDECGRFFSTKKTLGNHKCPVAQGGTRWVNA